MRNSGRNTWSTRAWGGLLALCCTATCAAAGITPDFLMDSDPEIRLPDPIVEFNPALKSLWLEALQRPDADMQRMAAETIARAHQFGVPDLAAAAPQLERIVEDQASHPAARYAAAHALIVLDSRGSAEKLFSAAQVYGSDLRQLVEPALAAWDFGPAREAWIKRLDDPQTRRRELVLALRGLGRTGDASVLPRLLALVDDATRPPDLRLEAATSAGQIAESGLESNADRLARETRSPPIGPLCAVRLLARHNSESAQQLLIFLAGRSESAVTAAALTRLNELDPALAVPVAASALQHTDPDVRRQGAQVWLKLPTVERMAPLAQLLADPHPDIRCEVCEALATLAEKPELTEAIRTSAMTMLAGDRWQGQEQAALLLGALEHKPAAGRLVELLESPRAEPKVAAAWALRKVAVPETIPGIIDRATRESERRQKTALVPGDDEEVAHLFEALGVLNAAVAEPLLKEYIPKRFFMGERSRSAAIWALGRMYAERRDADLENAFLDRIADFPERDSESDLVKQMCAVGLVRMQASDTAPFIKSVIEGNFMSVRVGAALRWAVMEMTGEQMAGPQPDSVRQREWFLEPLP